MRKGEAEGTGMILIFKTYWFLQSTLYIQPSLAHIFDTTKPYIPRRCKPTASDQDGALLTRQRRQDLLPGGGMESDSLRDADILAQEGRPGSQSLSEQRWARKGSHCDGLNGGKDEEDQLAQG